MSKDGWLPPGVEYYMIPGNGPDDDDTDGAWVEAADFDGTIDEHSCVRCGNGVGWCLTEREYATGDIVERAEFLIYLLSADGRRRWCEDCGMDLDGD